MMEYVIYDIQDMIYNRVSQEDIVIRMTGCPNSCGRPSMAEIGFIGKAPGTYNMYMGGELN